MKLSTLVSYHQHLEQFDSKLALDVLHKHLAPILHSVTTHELQFYDLTDQLITDLTNVQDNIQAFEKTLSSVKSSIKHMIETEEHAYFAQSYKLYDEEMRNDSTDLILNRRFELSDDSKDIVTGRIIKHSDWHYPGMIIRPGLEDWIDMLVALDPLYLVDDSYELLDHSINKFNQEYAQRLRKYVVNELNNEDQLLTALPDGQFGFVLAYNFFNFKPFEVVKQYLKETYSKLRPGGTFALTINDCDRPGGVKLAEQSFSCYTPKSLLVGLATSFGYELAFSYEVNAAVTWLEFKKPGELSSLRGGQALAKIVAKD